MNDVISFDFVFQMLFKPCMCTCNIFRVGCLKLFNSTKCCSFTLELNVTVVPTFSTIEAKEAIQEDVNYITSPYVKSWNSALSRFCKQGQLKDARHLFDKMPQPNVISWTVMLAGYAQNGNMEEARRMFDTMPRRNVVSWNTMIRGCIQNHRIEEAYQLFVTMPERNLSSWTLMIAGLGNAGKIEVSRSLFESLPQRDLIAWNAMITAYANNGRMEDAHHLFGKMPKRNVVSWTAMIVGYSKMGKTEQARQLFDKMPERNVVSWTAIIAGYTQNAQNMEALQLFSVMQRIPIRPNQSTLASAVNACANLTAFSCGSQVHALVIKMGFESDVVLQNSLIVMYAKSGGTGDAEQIFNKMSSRDLVSWNAMLAAHTQCGMIEEAEQLFRIMPDRDDFSWTTMLSGYLQNGRTEMACGLFKRMSNPDMVAWSAMIVGYEQNGHNEEVVKLFAEMQRTGIRSNHPIFTSVVKASGSLALLEQGKQVHAHIVKTVLGSDLSVENSLIAMYGKCGAIEDAYDVFDRMPERDVVSWNSLILGFAQHGHGKMALQLIRQMQLTSVEPDHITFLGVLSGCNHAGLVDEGWHYFNSMIHDYCITPRAYHYTCMVDLLARAGHLDQAKDFIDNMPLKPHAAVWGALLGACKLHSAIVLGKHAADHLLQLEPENAAVYVELANMYALAGRVEDEANVRAMKKEKRVKKLPGYSWIVVKNKVHTFMVGHPLHQKEEIHAT
ncbi:pentatricopeptide repeat-containing protein At1g53600, mitochondrial [Cryptomeria japonica]|uniref:pentatricopeptide repeat-containing protein At1g53600, mitochondrial n=1 Tax=Cryptomeria japonica TaxID=3369 RepID=UPI0027DA4AD9|nr:pentatricopeptide repeat-containing protein At1g53600, mitochondrial [Cryptomeria japonica]